MMENPGQQGDDVAPGFFRTRSGLVMRLPNPPRTGAAAAWGAPHQTANLLRTRSAREKKPVKATIKRLAEAKSKAVASRLGETRARRTQSVIDRAYRLPVQSIEEFASMLDLVLVSESTSLSEPCRQALECVLTGLTAMRSDREETS